MSKNQSDIQKFYDGKVIFLTGATGYIGKLLLEKCLRSLNLKRIYILIRVKKGRDQSTRLNKLLESPIFDQVKNSDPNFKDKISILNGDLSLPELGLSEKDIQKMINEVNCVIHCAATVSFTEHLTLATKMNVIASRDLIRIAKQMHNLDSYVHVSTAYSNMNKNEIDEKFYEASMEPKKLFKMVDALDEDYITDLTPKIINDFPNTYTFTKNVSETVIKREGAGLPLSIIRPSIVMSCHQQPIPGFVDNYLTVSGLAVAVGLGLTRTLMLNKNLVLDIVPADYVVNQILAIGWGNRKSNSDNQSKDINIYNCVSGYENPIKQGELIKQLMDAAIELGCAEKMLWYPFVVITSSPTLHKIYSFFLNVIPLYILDLVLNISGRKPFVMNLFNRFESSRQLFVVFMINQWKFNVKNTNQLYDSLSQDDKELFNFNIKKVYWPTFMFNNAVGMKKYLVKDLNSVETSKQKLRRFYYIHLMLIGFIAIFVCYSLKFIYLAIFR